MDYLESKTDCYILPDVPDKLEIGEKFYGAYANYGY